MHHVMKPFVHSRYRFSVTGLYLATLSAPPALGDEPSTSVMSAGSFLFELGSFGRPLPPAPPAILEGSEKLAVAELNAWALLVGRGSL